VLHCVPAEPEFLAEFNNGSHSLHMRSFHLIWLP
jgi:hypothetical protein